MADRWNDREDREWREHQRRTQRSARDDYGSGDYQDRDYALGDYDTGYRSFKPQDRDRPRGPVFGERETGANYTAPSYGGGGGYSGYTRYDNRDADRGHGGRYLGDDGRAPLYRSEYSNSPDDRAYADYGARRPGFDRDYPVERIQREPYRSEPFDRGDHNRDGRSFWDRASERVASWFGEFDDGQGDTRQAGHRGRGPKGYKRSDERINEDIHERLTDDVYLDASHIEVKVHSGEATLTGAVADRGAKHRAEQIVERVSGVDHVQNNLRVDNRHFFTTAGPGFGDNASEVLARTTSDDLTLNPGGKGRTQ